MRVSDNDDDATCYCLDIVKGNQVVATKVSILRSDKWSVCCSAANMLAKVLMNILIATTLLVGHKIYMMTTSGYILGLDLSTARFFVMELPSLFTDGLVKLFKNPALLLQ
jgi:hypothetical protein